MGKGVETGKLQKENGKWENVVNWRKYNEKDGNYQKSWWEVEENVDL